MGHNFVKIQYRVMQLDLHIPIVTFHIYVKFQANTFASFRNFQIPVKISEYFLSQFLTFKCDLGVKAAVLQNILNNH